MWTWFGSPFPLPGRVVVPDDTVTTGGGAVVTVVTVVTVTTVVTGGVGVGGFATGLVVGVVVGD